MLRTRVLSNHKVNCCLAHNKYVLIEHAVKGETIVCDAVFFEDPFTRAQSCHYEFRNNNKSVGNKYCTVQKLFYC